MVGVTYLAALRICDLERFVDCLLVYVRTIDLFPEHLRIRLHLALCQLNEAYASIFVSALIAS